MNAARVPIPRTALLARLKRRLGERGERLITVRSFKAQRSVGRFYTVDAQGRPNRAHVDPVKLARELGALEPWEFSPDFEGEDGPKFKWEETPLFRLAEKKR